jgi:hypothetical protein
MRRIEVDLSFEHSRRRISGELIHDERIGGERGARLKKRGATNPPAANVSARS